jgi:hypothetical protein
MAEQTKHPAPLELGAAVLVACIVQTLNESDNTLQARFLNRLERAYIALWDDPRITIHALEQLAWTKQLLTGWSFSDNEEKAFLED